MPVSSQAPPRLDLQIPPPKMLAAGEELKMAQAAFERNRRSPVLLFRVASMLVGLDRFNEAIALLEENGSVYDEAGPFENYRRFKLLYGAHIGFETEAGNLAARSAAERAVQAAPTPELRAAALADLAKTYTRFSDFDTSRRLLEQALEESPADKDAYKRLSRLYLRLAYRMIDRGVLHARVLGSVPLCLARLGRFAEARQAGALDEFLLSTTPAPPEGWSSLETFNEALTTEILNHPDMRYGRYGTASAKTWRVDEPLLHRSRAFPQLQQLIRREILTYVDALPSTDGHPLARACPAQAILRNWCVVTQGEGYETWHVHQNGWMSGVYYIHVQDHISQGIGPGGCLAFGISEEIAGNEAAAGYGERLVRPHTGLMMLFPSHSFHKTYPHGGEGHRICFAFDVVPGY